MTGAPPRTGVRGGWRVRSEQATVALVCAVIVGLLAGVLAGLHGRGDIAVQVAPAKDVAGGGELVPLHAVVIDPELNRPVVFVIVRGRALRQPVTVTPPPAGSTTVTVLSGLSSGTQVVVGPPQTLREGSSVTAVPYRGGGGS
jgi:multidrug efflux pump subunit AcrA (membrane-fusion protein)